MWCMCIEKEREVRREIVTVTVSGSHMLITFTNLLRVAHRQRIVVIGLLGVKVWPYFVHIQSDLWRTKSYLSQSISLLYLYWRLTSA